MSQLEQAGRFGDWMKARQARAGGQRMGEPGRLVFRAGMDSQNSGEAVLCHRESLASFGAPLAPALSPFVPHGAREPDALLGAAVSPCADDRSGRDARAPTAGVRLITNH